jgi:hypothetical protein
VLPGEKNIQTGKVDQGKKKQLDKQTVIKSVGNNEG